MKDIFHKVVFSVPIEDPQKNDGSVLLGPDGEILTRETLGYVIHFGQESFYNEEGMYIMKTIAYTVQLSTGKVWRLDPVDLKYDKIP